MMACSPTENSFGTAFLRANERALTASFECRLTRSVKRQGQVGAIEEWRLRATHGLRKFQRNSVWSTVTQAWQMSTKTPQKQTDCRVLYLSSTSCGRLFCRTSTSAAGHCDEE